MTQNPDKDFYAALPAKRMASGALYFNNRGELLIVKPTYRAAWLIPGGVVEWMVEIL
jgi:8-oxo-dGTP diphosphatase